uniref:Uncharacterized protein n=1 Tax=Macaca nemestrina TaxID=9545 RepID=A0A2K6DHU8_MACNE
LQHEPPRLPSFNPFYSVEGSFTGAMYNAFGNHLKEQLLSTPPDFTCALELLTEVKETLLSLLLPWQNRLRNEIEEALDTDLLKQEAEHGALDVPHLSNYILNLMTLLCAPVRDEAIQKLEAITDPGIFRVSGPNENGHGEHTIQSFRPYLQEHSIQYEQSLLDYTTKWLTKAATDITTPCPSSPDVACSLPNGAGNNSGTRVQQWCYYQGYLNLLLWDPENEEFPETLLMDRTRLQEMAFQLHQLTVLASVLLVARSFSGEILFSSSEFVDRLKCITKALTEEFIFPETMLSVSEQVSQEIHQGLKDMGLTTLSSENTASLLGQLQNITKKENCIRSIVGVSATLSWRPHSH